MTGAEANSALTWLDGDTAISFRTIVEKGGNWTVTVRVLDLRAGPVGCRQQPSRRPAWRGGPGRWRMGDVVDSGHLIGFTVASLVLIVVPGPGVLFVVGRALAHGRRTAFLTAAGHCAGNYLVAACVSVGLGTLLQRSETAFTVVKVAGAAYLVVLGVQAVRHRRSLAEAVTPGAASSSGWRALRDGLVVGVTNPKSFILFGAILPQFVSRAAGHVAAQMLALALVSVGLGLISDMAWGLAASGVRAWLARSPRRLALVGGAGGLAMITVGLTIAVTGRKD
jgi:threonine/homoserine/homoserine lactone efflux protein